MEKQSDLSEEPPEDENAPTVSEDDVDVPIEFSRRLDLPNSKYTDYRHLKLLCHCAIIAEQVADSQTQLNLER